MPAGGGGRGSGTWHGALPPMGRLAGVSRLVLQASSLHQQGRWARPMGPLVFPMDYLVLGIALLIMVLFVLVLVQQKRAADEQKRAADEQKRATERLFRAVEELTSNSPMIITDAMYEKLHGATFAILDDEGHPVCCGFFVSTCGVALTAAHSCEYARPSGRDRRVFRASM